MNEQKQLIEEVEKEECEHFDKEVCSRLNCNKDCKYYGKANCYRCIHKDICELRSFSYCEEEVREKGCEYYQQEIPEDAIVLTREEYEELKQAKTLLEFREETIKCLEDANIRYAKALENKVKDTAKNYKNFMILSIAEMLKYGEINPEQSEMLYNHNYQIYKGFIEELKMYEQVEDPVKEIYKKGKELDKDFDMTGLGEYILANFLTDVNNVKVE